MEPVKTFSRILFKDFDIEVPTFSRQNTKARPNSERAFVRGTLKTICFQLQTIYEAPNKAGCQFIRGQIWSALAWLAWQRFGPGTRRSPEREIAYLARQSDSQFSGKESGQSGAVPPHSKEALAYFKASLWFPFERLRNPNP